MIVLHGTWKPPVSLKERGEFFFWGESSLFSFVKGRGRPSRTSVNKPKLHPFQANEKDLLTALEVLNFENGSKNDGKMHHETMIFLLPSSLKKPHASPELIWDEEGNPTEDKVELLPWNIKGSCISLRNAILMLFSISQIWKEQNNVLIGADLRFWSKVSKFVMELLSKQRFIPSLVRTENNNEEIFVRWQHVLENQDESSRISMLLDAMPPICKAHLQYDSLNAQETFLSDFFNAVIDECIRNWIFISESRNKRSCFSKTWLESLATGESLKNNQAKFTNFLEETFSWQEQIQQKEKIPFRTCFRLEPPFENENLKSNEWKISYYLQALDDLSLLVPAEKIWKSSKSTLEFLNRKFEYPQEKLLTDLGKASRLYPPIEDSLHLAKPISAHLSTQQAYDFLKEASSLLQDSGFGVIVPNWWNKTAHKTALGVKLNLKPKRPPKKSTGIFDFNTLVKFDWELALGDEPISEEELEKLASLKEPFVHVRGQWVELKKEDIETALNFLKSKKSGEIKLSEALKLSIGYDVLENDLPINGFTASGWLSNVIDCFSGKKAIEELPAPKSFVGELRPYQKKGFSWLHFLQQFKLGACLADDMGLGKTIQLLALLLKNKEQKVKNPTLVICPTSVIGNWQKEAARFAPSLQTLIHHGPNRKKKEDFLSEILKYDLVISSYALAYRDEDTFKDIEWNGIVLDEAQNVKNCYTKQAQAVRNIKANFRLALTGTPIENRLSELWSIIDFLNPGYLGSLNKFHKYFELPIERYNSTEVRSRLKTIVQPFILRRLKTDPTIIKDLPNKIETKVFCNLTKEQASLYKAVVKDMLGQIDELSGIKRKGTILSALTKLKQVCNHPAHFLKDSTSIPGRSGKLNRLVEMLEEILAGEDRTLIFTQFAEMGKILKTYFQDMFGQEVFFLHGGVPQKSREKMISRFSENNGPKIFILSLKAGGLGLNLTQANHVFHFDRWWNPAVENQATDRAFRIGQIKNVQVHKFICVGTLEERIDEMIENKKALAENIVGTGEGWLTEMSTEQLKELFALRHETVIDE